MMKAGSRGSTSKHTRLARVNESLREVIADELERVDDERLELVTVTGIKVTADLKYAQVFFDSLREAREVAGALAEQRVGLQAAVGRQLRLKRTPELTFVPDPAIAEGTRVEQILRGLHHDEAGEPPDPVVEDGSP